MRDVLLLIILVGLIPFVMVRPWIGVLVWSWISYMNPHKLGWGFTHSLPVAMVFGGLTLAMMFTTNEKKGFPVTRETIILLMLCVLFSVSTFFAWAPESAFAEWDKVMKILLFTFVTMMLIRGRDRIYALILVIVFSIGFYGVKGGIFSLTSGGQYHVYGPPDSFIGDNTTLGLALVMTLPLIVATARAAPIKWVRWAGYGAVLMTITATVFTYSRGALLGLAATLPFLFLAARRKGLLLLLIVPVALAGLSFAPEKLLHRESTISTYKKDNSAMQRIQAWGVAWNVAVHSPLVGAGFKLEDVRSSKWLQYAFFMGDWKNTSRAAHSIYFQVLGEQGFVGLILFVLLIVFSLRTLGKVKKQANASESHSWMAEYASALQIGLIGYAVSGAFLSLAYFDLFYGYVALAVIMQREVLSSPVAEAARPAKAVTARLEEATG